MSGSVEVTNSSATTTPGAPPPARRGEALVRTLVAVVAVAVYLPPVTQVGLLTDLGAHLRFAESMAVTGRTNIPFALFEQLAIIVRALVPYELLAKVDPSLGERQAIWDLAGVVAVLAIVAVLSQLVYVRIRAAGRPDGAEPAPVAVTAVLTLAALVVAPLTFLSWSSHHLLLGYVGITGFENPTNLLAKPFALALLVMVSAAFTRKADARSVTALAVVSVLSLMAKPSFTICFLPAVVVVWAWRRRRDRTLEWRLTTFGFIVPSVLALGVQALVATGQAGIGFSPFSVVARTFDALDRPTALFAAYVVASIAFPLATVALATRDERRVLALPWVAFAAALAQFCLFGITGRTDYGDLAWGAQICLFLLFVESCALLAGRFRRAGADGARGGWRGGELALVALLGAHVLCGLVLAYHETFDPAAWW